MSLAVQTVFLFICYVRIYGLFISLRKFKMAVYLLPARFQEGLLLVLLIANMCHCCLFIYCQIQ